MNDIDTDRKDRITSVVDLLQTRHGDLFKTFPVARQAREVVSAVQGLIASDEVMVIIRRVSGDRPKQAAVANALARAKERGLIHSPRKGLWGASLAGGVYGGGSDPTSP
jgi:hypothetical protein